MVRVDLVLGLVTVRAALWFRRRWPMTIAAIHQPLGALSEQRPGPGVLAAVSLATRRRWSQVVTIGVTGLAAGLRRYARSSRRHRRTVVGRAARRSS